MQFRRDVDTIVYSLPPLQAPAYLNGKTKREIEQEAKVIRLKAQLKSAEDRVLMLTETAKDYADEDAIRNDAASELAKISIRLQKTEGGGGLEQPSMGCVMHVSNQSRHTIQRLWFRADNTDYGRDYGYSDSTGVFDALAPGETITLNECGESGWVLVETEASAEVQAERAALAGSTKYELSPWENPDEKLRTLKPEVELPEQLALIAELQGQLKAAQ